MLSRDIISKRFRTALMKRKSKSYSDRDSHRHSHSDSDSDSDRESYQAIAITIGHSRCYGHSLCSSKKKIVLE